MFLNSLLPGGFNQIKKAEEIRMANGGVPITSSDERVMGIKI